MGCGRVRALLKAKSKPLCRPVDPAGQCQLCSGNFGKMDSRIVFSGVSQLSRNTTFKFERQQWRKSWTGNAALPAGHERQVPGSPIPMLIEPFHATLRQSLPLPGCRVHSRAAGPRLKPQARYLARGGVHKVYEGDWTPRSIVILEFPSVAAWEQFYEGP